MLQDCVSIAAPTQSFPPLTEAGLLQALVRLATPPPQVTLQEPQAAQ